MTDVKAILEALKKFESADEGTEIYWKAQDIALEGCKAISDKLQEHIKNGYVEDFYNVLYNIVALIEHEKQLDPRTNLSEIQDDANAFSNEENSDDKNWLRSGIDDGIHRLTTFNNLIQEKL